MFATVSISLPRPRDLRDPPHRRHGRADPERFAELSASGYVDAASPIDPMEAAGHLPDEPEGEDAEQAEAGARARRRPCSRPGGVDEAGACARRTPGAGHDRAAAAAGRDRGEGRLRPKANKAQLAELLGALWRAVRDARRLRAEVRRGGRWRRRQGRRAAGRRERHAAVGHESRYGAYAQGRAPGLRPLGVLGGVRVASRAMSAPARPCRGNPVQPDGGKLQRLGHVRQPDGGAVARQVRPEAARPGRVPHRRHRGDDGGPWLASYPTRPSGVVRPAHLDDLGEPAAAASRSARSALRGVPGSDRRPGRDAPERRGRGPPLHFLRRTRRTCGAALSRSRRGLRRGRRPAHCGRRRARRVEHAGGGDPRRWVGSSGAARDTPRSWARPRCSR